MGRDGIMADSNGNFLSRSVSDIGYIAADSVLGDFVAANLLSPQADLAWRGDSAADILIQINLKEFELIDTLALCLHNMTSTATVTVDFYDSRVNPALLTVTETVGGIGTIPQYKNKIMSFAEVNAQEIDITISDIGNTDGYVQIRRLKMGLITKLTKGFDFSYKFGFVSGEQYRAGEITWAGATESEMNTLNELIRDFGVDPDKYARTRSGELLGFDDDILWMGYPEATNSATKNQHTALVALVGAEAPFRPNLVNGVFTAQIEEILHEITPTPPTAFITTWRTTITNETITLPATGVNSFVVDWGDGSTEVVTAASPSHVYASAGDYVVTIEGVCRKWYQNNTGDRSKLVSLVQWGDVGFTELDSAFYGCDQAQILATDAPNLAGITSIKLIFGDCSASDQFHVAKWDVKDIEDFSQAFYKCKPTNGFPIASWDVSNGLIFDGILNDCGDITGTQMSTWTITSATSMIDMLLLTIIAQAEYDAILISWAAQAHQSGVTFHAGTAKYSVGAGVSRAVLVADGWTITDGGPA